MLISAFLVFSVNTFPQELGAKRPLQTEKFVWRYGGHKLGTLDVPRGFAADTENYTEGIVTRLRYPDGACFVLQWGFMYRIPLFQDSEHILDSSEKLSGKTVRRGHYANKPEVWGEADYEPRKPIHRGASLFEIISPHLGYEHVPTERGENFARALESFVPAP